MSKAVTMPAGTGAHDNPVPITSEKAGHLIDAIRGAYQRLALDHATDDDAVFFDLVAAWLIHPGSKFESIETLAEVGRASVSYRTIQRRLPRYATTPFRDRVTHALSTYAAIGPSRGPEHPGSAAAAVRLKWPKSGIRFLPSRTRHTTTLPRTPLT